MSKRTEKTRALLFCAVLVLSAPAIYAEVSDLLDRPATVSGRALRSVQLAVARAGKRLVSVGERGTVLLSDDDGRTWRQAKVPVSLTLTCVCFASERSGWAAGHSGVVLRTSDGGETWVKQLDGRQAAQIELAAAKAAAAGDAAAQRRLAEAERLVSDGPDKPFLGVFFPDEQNGFALGAYGLIFGTTDGGETWRSLQPLLDNPKSRHLYAMGAVGRDWYVAGEQGLVFRSEDAGKSFVPVNTPYTGSYFGILSGAKAELFVFGLRGNVYRSEDGGSTWTKIETGVPASVTGGTRLGDGSLVLVDEAGRLVRSDDGGRTFRPIPVPQPLPFTGVVQASDGNVVASGVAGVNRLVVTGNSNRGESKP